MSAATIDPEALAAALRARPGAGAVGRRVEYLPRVGSTNDRARELAASGEPEGTAVIAGEQTRGRGRSDRTWHSPPGLGLYVSVILRPAAEPAQAPLFGLLAAVAAASALGSLAPGGLGIEWPNDIVLANQPGGGPRRKIAGVLAESRTAPGGIRDLIVGVGVNVNHLPGDFPESFAPQASSLRIAAGAPVSLQRVALALLTALDDWYTLWSREGSARVIDGYAQRGLGLNGCRVRVTGVGSPFSGVTAGLTPDGALAVRRDTDGATELIRYGDVARLQET